MKYAFVIEPSEHAELSASGAERWTTCPGSIALSRGLPNFGSKFSSEGTAAHHIAAACQNDGGSPYRWRGQVALVDGFDINLDDELLDAVQELLDYIAATERPGDVAHVETSFTAALKRLHPKLGGSGDRVTWRESERLLIPLDYKHGAGVAVSVVENKQLKTYALGALLTFPQYNAEDVELVIAQPRCEHEEGRFRRYRFKAFDLVEFAGELIEAAKATEEFGADLVPSTKACKWCPAMRANKCPAVERQSHALVQASFDVVAPELYSREQIAEFLTKAPLVEARINAIREFAYSAALRGADIPGFKLVEKRATRKWSDEYPVVSALQNEPGAFTVPELKSPAQIEKLLGKKKFKQFESHIIKQSSGMTLAPASDPRPPAQVAQLEDFSDVSGTQ